jgi:hypothetical protein
VSEPLRAMIAANDFVNEESTHAMRSSSLPKWNSWHGRRGSGIASPPTPFYKSTTYASPLHTSMPPIPSSQSLPRLIVYYQTHHDSLGKPISALPLIGSGVTHVYIAAIHLNDPPEDITLNDNHPDHERNGQLWDEVKTLQDNGVKVLGMLGGAARGSYQRLGRDVSSVGECLNA